MIGNIERDTKKLREWFRELKEEREKRKVLFERAKKGDKEAKEILEKRYHLRVLSEEEYLKEKKMEKLLPKMKRFGIPLELKNVGEQLVKLKKEWKEIVEEFGRIIETCPERTFFNGMKKLILIEKYSREGINFILKTLCRYKEKEWMIRIISDILMNLNPWKTCEKNELRLWREFLEKFSKEELHLLLHHLFWDINVISKTFSRAYKGKRVKGTLVLLISNGIEEVRNIFLKKYLAGLVGKGKIRKRRIKIPKVKVKVIKKGDERYFFLGKCRRKPVTGTVPRNVWNTSGDVLTLFPKRFLKFYGWIFKTEEQDLYFFVRELKTEIRFLIFRETQAIRDYILLHENVPLLPFRRRIGENREFLLAVVRRKRVKVKLSSWKGYIVEMRPKRKEGKWILEFYKLDSKEEKIRSYKLCREFPYLKRIN
ncbi:hypothetical protein DRN73_10380 [Candidatus Pacearchaeota archaeon]|nr:MAG: hypothetical protein DRN73_10380 [Candidatus Pacearchaeota archaeon]